MPRQGMDAFHWFHWFHSTAYIIMCILRFIKSFWPTLLTLGVILYATLTPDPLGDEKLPMFPHADKMVHAVMMGGLTGAVLFDLRRADRRERLGRETVLAVGAGVLLFSFADEWLQGQIGIGRPSDIYDAAANAAGVVVAMLTAPSAVRALLPQSPRIKRKEDGQ